MINKNFNFKKSLFINLLIIIALCLTGCNQYENNEYEKSKIIKSKYVNVKYRDDAVDIGNSRWEYTNTSGSSFINGIWYDQEEYYMIIKLNETYYHYCGLDEITYNAFILSPYENNNEEWSNLGSFYSTTIKGNFDCRIYHVPEY